MFSVWQFVLGWLGCFPYCKNTIQSSESKSFQTFEHTLYSRRLMGSTDQADPSCIYFRISWILIDRPWFYFFLSPPLVAGPQKYKHKIGHKYFTFQHPKKLGAFFLIIKIRVIVAVKCFLKIEIFWGHEVLKLHFKCSKNSISRNIMAPKCSYLIFEVVNFWGFRGPATIRGDKKK